MSPPAGHRTRLEALAAAVLRAPGSADPGLRLAEVLDFEVSVGGIAGG